MALSSVQTFVLELFFSRVCYHSLYAVFLILLKPNQALNFLLGSNSQTNSSKMKGDETTIAVHGCVRIARRARKGKKGQERAS